MKNTEHIGDGGPAFPTLEVIATDQDGPVTHAFLGMTLRDYFAAKAMQGYISNSEFNYEKRELIAQGAYEFADAMLKAREA